ncbi:MAG TPA: sulfatase-like hydrolase/transferase [Candidatus Udaeobacter sp.]|jgi:arylsulfatase A-like enzyme|nr:sulfatase-like hydrolase/transferase [Candidatus Udaeobacter sp.]
MASQRKPNLILFLPDQQRADTLACYGGFKVHAPNLNKLASESVIFERAYVTHPVCTPSRSALMTGTWPHINGCTRNSVPLDPRFLAFPLLMQGSDYHTAYVGKWHLGEDGPAVRGFHEWISTDDHGDYTEFITEAGVKPDKSDGRFSEFAISNLPIELSRPKFLERHACDFIEKHQRDPFILVVGFVEPHSPYNGPLNDEHPLDEVELDATATLPDSENTPLRYRLMREWQQAEAILDRERLPFQLFFGITPEEYRSIKQRYLGLVTLVDRSIGAILACVERCGLTDDTIVIHTSDHGDSLGAHHLFGKETMFEEAARVPWLIRLAGQKRGRVVSQPVGHIDFVPTLLDLLGQPKHAQCAGKSLLPLINEQAVPTQHVILEWAPNRTKIKKGTRLARRRIIKRAVEESTRTVVARDGWKLCLRDKDSNELYNLNDDPLETRNLYLDRQYASVISHLSDEIHRWQESTNDTVTI